MTTHKKEAWEIAYDDWRDLLVRANAEELAYKPDSVFDEAWRQATMRITQLIEQELSAEDAAKVNATIYRKMLK